MEPLNKIIKIVFGLTIVAGLAIAAAILPSSKSSQYELLTVESGSKTNKENQDEKLANQENIDLLVFTLRPKEILNPESIPVKTPTTTTQKKSATENSANKKSNFIEKNDSKTFSEKIKAQAAQQYNTRVQAAQKEDTETCSQISSASVAQTCKDEITFQEAITKGNPELCQEIKDAKLKARCEKTF